jgi:hypothetical protein
MQLTKDEIEKIADRFIDHGDPDGVVFDYLGFADALLVESARAPSSEEGKPDHQGRLTSYLMLLVDDALRGRVNKARAEKALAFMTEAGLVTGGFEIYSEKSQKPEGL